MDQSRALNILIQAANVAQNKGAFSLQEASTVAAAIATFVTKPEPSSVEKTDSTEEEND